MVIRTGEREISAVSGRLPDSLGELACMKWLANTCRPHSIHLSYWTYHTIYSWDWAKNLQQEFQNYHSTTNYASTLSQLCVHGDIAKMDSYSCRVCSCLSLLLPVDSIVSMKGISLRYTHVPCTFTQIASPCIQLTCLSLNELTILHLLLSWDIYMLNVGFTF